MVNLKSISATGFKGHESTVIPAKDINVITGRNNVGKTSILEAANICFKPSEIRQYGENVNTLINAHKDRADIQCKFTYEGGQRRLSEFDGEEVVDRGVALREPNQTQIIDFLSKILLQQIQTGSNFERWINIRPEQREKVLSKLQANRDTLIQDLKTNLSQTVEQSMDEILTEDMLSDFTIHSVLVDIDGESYPYVYLGGEYEEFVSKISEYVANELISGIDEDEEDTFQEIAFATERSLQRAILGRYGRGFFIEEPPSVDGVRFIHNLDITQKNIESSENYTVTLTEIEDFIREHNILDNLRDFNLDALVFEENEDRYAIPYEFMGDGFKSIVGLLWELMSQEKRSDVILLEEPENHMHPGYIQTLVEFLTDIAKKEGIQLLITTHNVDFISSFFELGTTHEEYLRDNFQIVQMQEEIAQILEYDMAEEDLNELHLDLRGL